MKIPEGLEGVALHKWLKENKGLLISAKKSEMKRADAFSSHLFVDNSGCIVKEQNAIPADANRMEATLIINTTNLLDSHMDVHIPGIWKKSLKETKDIYHLQEHRMQFDKVISDSVRAFTKTYSWRELGYDANGTTEALVFISTISKDRNSFMFDQYRKGWVKQHSVGMRYVQLYLCVNEPDNKYYRDEYEAWEKYYPEIINPEMADEKGYFWAVPEAKVVEGSAVPLGSNWITPTQSLKSDSTEEQPAPATVKQPQKFDLMKAIKEARIIPA